LLEDAPSGAQIAAQQRISTVVRNFEIHSLSEPTAPTYSVGEVTGCQHKARPRPPIAVFAEILRAAKLCSCSMLPGGRKLQICHRRSMLEIYSHDKQPMTAVRTKTLQLVRRISSYLRCSHTPARAQRAEVPSSYDGPVTGIHRS